MRTLAQQAQGCQNLGLAMTSPLPCRLKVSRALVITQSHSNLSNRVQYKAVSPPEKFLLWNPLPLHHHSLHLIGQLWSKSSPTPRGRAPFLRKNPYFSNFWGSPASHLGKSSTAPLQPLLMRLSGCTVFLTGLLVMLWGKGNLQPPDPGSPPQSTYRIPPYPSQSTKHRDHFSSTRRSLTAAPFPPYCLVAKSCPTLQTRGLRHTRLSLVHHILESVQMHIHWVRDTIHPSHPITIPSLPAGKPLWVESLLPIFFCGCHYATHLSVLQV